jgi:hypothetical protein
MQQHCPVALMLSAVSDYLLYTTALLLLHNVCCHSTHCAAILSCVHTGSKAVVTGSCCATVVDARVLQGHTPALER